MKRVTGLKIGYKLIILTLLLISTIYLIKTDNSKEKKHIPEELKEESTLERIYTIEDPEYWIGKLQEKHLILMDEEKVEEINHKNFSKVDSLIELSNHNSIIEKEDLVSMINSASSIPKEERYNKEGNIMDKDYYNLLLSNLNLESIENKTAIQYGITIDRTVLRTFPTFDPSYRKKEDTQFDRFQETAIYPCEPVILYSESTDGQWYFGRIYNYMGWIPKENIALGQKEKIFEFINKEPFIVVIDRQTTIGNKLFDMGIRIPLKEEKDNSYIALIPEKDQNNELNIIEKEISKSTKLNLGYLPYTKENIIQQAFKFKDEKYGWGGLNNTRDCSAFIMDIYRTFGIKLPRNTQEQGAKTVGRGYDFNHIKTLEEKIEILEELPIATVLYMPGHTMLYLGKDYEKYYIIHQFAEYYVENNGGLERVPMMKTAVTPVTIKTSSGKTYLESVYLGKEFIIE